MYFPTAKAARAGTQTGQVVYADEKRVPRAASRSRFGVTTIGWPAQPITFGLCSSDMITIILRGEAATASFPRARLLISALMPPQHSAFPSHRMRVCPRAAD